MSNEIFYLSGFLIFIFTLLLLDLGVFNKKDAAVSLQQAGLMSVLVILISLGFYILITYFGHHIHGIDSMERLQEIVKKHQHPIKIIPGNLEHSIMLYDKNLGLEYLTGYVVEYALSIDNIFVILLVFSAFGVAPRNYHRVLFWGIFGAIVMRFLFIFVGAALIQRFEWIMYIFGAFLVYTGIKMYIDRNKHEKIDPQNHPVVKFAQKHFNVHNRFVGNKFFVVIDGVRKMTPLFLVLIIIEFTDLIFAVDSIPAIFSITKDPYIVFFSNIFAIIGLRSMFFLLAGIVDKFRFLKVGLAVLLTFIGLKMIFEHYLENIGFGTSHSLIVIVSILLVSMMASLLFPDKKAARKRKNLNDGLN